MDPKTVIAGALLILGCFLLVVASIGLIRFPDFYSRIHPAGKSDTLGQALIILGLAIYEGFSLVGIKLAIILVFIFIANPTATHSLAKAAYVAGIKPWEKKND